MGIPYTFTLDQDVLLISRMSHNAVCQRVEDISFDCVEDWDDGQPPSKYRVKAKVIDGKVLSFSPPLGEGDAMLVARCPE